MLTCLAIILLITTSSSAETAILSEAYTSTLQEEPNGHRENESRSPVFDFLRERDRGVSLTPVYYGEVFTNTRGGRSTKGATRYLGLLDLPITLDFEKLGCRVPGRFFLLGQNTHGEGLTDDFVGDTLVVSNIDSSINIARVSEYWWEVGVLDGTTTVRLGKQDVNTEFLLIETAVDFINSTFGLSPSTAFPTYPDQSMAAVVLVELTDSWYARVGVWDAFSSGGKLGFLR